MSAEKKTILLVDDDESITKVLSIRLSVGGYEVISTTDGSEAVRVARDRKPDLVILDLMMPLYDGFTVMDELRNSIITEDIPVIVLTAYDSEENKRRANELNAVAYFRKPYRDEEFIEAVERALSIPGD